MAPAASGAMFWKAGWPAGCIRIEELMRINALRAGLLAVESRRTTANGRWC